MIWDSKDQELRVRLYEIKAIPADRAKLLKWLDVYTYILPANRTLYGGFCNISCSSSKGLFGTWLYLDFLESTLSYEDQVKLWQLINVYSTSHTLPF
jgi:hypothetical protein